MSVEPLHGRRFHSNCGSLVTLSDGNRTATRNQTLQEFNNGIVMGESPLLPGEIFLIEISAKVTKWSGSLVVGVTAITPEDMVLPASAAMVPESTWVVTGHTVLIDGKTVADQYGGVDLDSLGTGDRVGVERTDNGELHIWVNGVDQGTAAEGLPRRVFAVIDVYGLCAEVRIADCLSLAPVIMAHDMMGPEKLGFHSVCGEGVQIFDDRASHIGRDGPVRWVTSNRSVKAGEFFEIEICSMDFNGAYNLCFGVTVLSPLQIDHMSATAVSEIPSGTLSLANGMLFVNRNLFVSNYGPPIHYTVGTRLGFVLSTTGSLNFYVNGADLGVALTRVPPRLFAFIDIDNCEVRLSDKLHNDVVCTTNESPTEDINQLEDGEIAQLDCETDKLLFHKRCGDQVRVVDGSRSAVRINDADNFNNGVVLTTRALHPGEMFTVRIDRMVNKWAGSLEVGVTTHTPLHLDSLPSTMTNAPTDGVTWLLTSAGVLHNGVCVKDDYGPNLDGAVVGDTVGVVVRGGGKERRRGNSSRGRGEVCGDEDIDGGEVGREGRERGMDEVDGDWERGEYDVQGNPEERKLYFYFNGSCLGVAASNLPGRLYGVIDLYGRATQASIVDELVVDDDNDESSIIDSEASEVYFETAEILQEPGSQQSFRFHLIHGTNALISNQGLTASRPNAGGEFNNAVVLSNQVLQDDQLFEIVIEELVERWSGSLEAGVTRVDPALNQFPPASLTDPGVSTWMLSGSSIVSLGQTVSNEYRCDLDSLSVGTRVGIMVQSSDRSLHFYINGVDMGPACCNVASGCYAFVDLYGQCSRISIQPTCFQDSTPYAYNLPSGGPHVFHQRCGRAITLEKGATIAVRRHGYQDGLVFSAAPLAVDEIWEVRMTRLSSLWAGPLSIGLTTVDPSGLSNSVPSRVASLGTTTWSLSGSTLHLNGEPIREGYGNWDAATGRCLAVVRARDNCLRFLIDGVDMGSAFSNLPIAPPCQFYGIMEVYGEVERVELVSRTRFIDYSPTALSHITSTLMDFAAGNHAANVSISNGNRSATRRHGYNRGVVVGSTPIGRNTLVSVRVDEVTPGYSGGVQVGVALGACLRVGDATSAVALQDAWVVAGHGCVYRNRARIRADYGTDLSVVSMGDTVGIYIDVGYKLHVVVNGDDMGVAATGLGMGHHNGLGEGQPLVWTPIVDLYGQCRSVTMVKQTLCDVKSIGSNILMRSREKVELAEGKKDEVNNRMKRLPVGNRVPDGNNVNIVPRGNIAPVGNRVPSSRRRPCEYFNLCARYKASLCLPQGFFESTQPPVCYCLFCYPSSGTDNIPSGWCRFPLCAPPRGSPRNTEGETAYHATHEGALRRILDERELLVPSKMEITTGRLVDPTCLGEDRIILTPVVQYAETMATTELFKDSSNKQSNSLPTTTQPLSGSHGVKVILEVLINSGSYTYSAPFNVALRTGSRRATDNDGSEGTNSHIHWSTKEKGATSLKALLVKIYQKNIT